MLYSKGFLDLLNVVMVGELYRESGFCSLAVEVVDSKAPSRFCEAAWRGVSASSPDPINNRYGLYCTKVWHWLVSRFALLGIKGTILDGRWLGWVWRKPLH